jgi:hypothetical protein
MPNVGNPWNRNELDQLAEAYKKKPTWVNIRQFAKEYSKASGRGVDSIRGQLQRMIHAGQMEKQYVQPSPYPSYDSPLEMEGDALILPDLEFPYHNSEFVNRVLDLAETWKIKQCILAGDVLHFDGLSGWNPSWSAPNTGGLTAEAEAKLSQFAKTLSPKKQGEFFEMIGDLGQRTEQDGLSTELNVARRELRRILQLFDRVDMILGNHCGRLLTALEVAIDPTELLRLLETGERMRIAPYYFMYLDTIGGRYVIEHPKNAGKFSAGKLCSKYKAHVLMAHSHQLNFTLDVSGTYYAVEIGCCVSEDKLPYASQRHNIAPAHSLGAVIVRRGYPYLLHPGIPWEEYKRMA